MKTLIFSLMLVLFFVGAGLAYTQRQETQYTVNSSTTDGVYQVERGTYVFTDSLLVSSAPAASFTPRATIHGWSGIIDSYGILFSTAQTNFRVGITTPTASQVGQMFWDNTQGEICISTGSSNCYDYGKLSIAKP